MLILILKQFHPTIQIPFWFGDKENRGQIEDRMSRCYLGKGGRAIGDVGISVKGNTSFKKKVIQRFKKGSKIYLKPAYIMINLPGVLNIQSPTESLYHHSSIHFDFFWHITNI